jgi:hypothetical protein
MSSGSHSPDRAGKSPLACPFFKRDPVRYGTHKLCPGPTGWPTIARLKYGLVVTNAVLTFTRGHLYKDHFIEICPVCNRIFAKGSQLIDHYNPTTATDRCSGRGRRIYAQGFGAAQRDELKSRKKEHVFSNVDDVELREFFCWQRIYHILFPDVDKSSIPSKGKRGLDPPTPRC